MSFSIPPLKKGACRPRTIPAAKRAWPNQRAPVRPSNHFHSANTISRYNALGMVLWMSPHSQHTIRKVFGNSTLSKAVPRTTHPSDPDCNYTKRGYRRRGGGEGGGGGGGLKTRTCFGVNVDEKWIRKEWYCVQLFYLKGDSFSGVVSFSYSRFLRHRGANKHDSHSKTTQRGGHRV